MVRLTSLRLLVATVVPGSILVSCKMPNEASRLRTLDNIGLSAPVFEACEGANKVHPKAGLSSEPHLLKALAAVPMSVQNGFFDDLGGRIRISSPSECSSQSSREDDVLGCWKRSSDPKQSVEIIVTRSSKTKEQYSLVRTFGFVYGDILLHRAIPKSNLSPVKITASQLGSLEDFKAQMASTFLGELAQSIPPSGKTQLNSTLSKMGISSSVISEKDAAKRWVKFRKLPTKVKNEFSSRVFAEAFHSQFCVPNSVQSACKNFPETMEQFRPYAIDVTSQSGERFISCPQRKTLTSSASHLEFNTLYQDSITKRRNHGADNGAFVNAKIAEKASQRLASTTAKTGVKSNKAGFQLTGGLLENLLGMITGGLSIGGGDGGVGGLLSQILGGIGGGGGGGGGIFGSLLSMLGLDSLFFDDEGDDFIDNNGGDDFSDNNDDDFNDNGGDNFIDNGGNNGEEDFTETHIDNLQKQQVIDQNTISIPSGPIDNGSDVGKIEIKTEPIKPDMTINYRPDPNQMIALTRSTAAHDIDPTAENSALDAVNSFRKSKGMRVLKVDPKLIDDCRQQARLQADKKALYHWLYRPGLARAENITFSELSPSDIVNKEWAKSPSHLANILGRFEYVGIGKFGNHWCQRFR